jgi:hypothetical protein
MWTRYISRGLLYLESTKHYSFKMRVLLFSFSVALCLAAAGYSHTSPREAYLREILGRSKYVDFPATRTPSDVPLKVGIIGAGAGGLYTAILLESLGIDYDIIEASDRVGGRIFTHRFNETAWSRSTPQDPDYYDYYVSCVKRKDRHNF